MNASSIKLREHYRIGYSNNDSGEVSSTWARFVTGKTGAQSLLNQMEQLRSEHPNLTFWLEKFNPNNTQWEKLKIRSIYALFSPDEPELEEEKPVKKEEPDPNSPWVFIPDNDDNVPF